MKKKRREGKGGSRGQQAKEQKRKRTHTNQTEGGRRVVEEALVALARLWPEKPDAKWEGER